MNRALRLAVGASMMLFGTVWYALSVLIVEVAYGGWNGPAYLGLAVMATFFLTVGVFFLVYGAAGTPGMTQPAGP